MYFITTKRMLEVCFSAHPNIQYRTFCCLKPGKPSVKRFSGFLRILRLIGGLIIPYRVAYSDKLLEMRGKKRIFMINNIKIPL